MSIKRAVALFLCCAVIGLCVYQTGQVETGLQYVLPAPASHVEKDEQGNLPDSEMKKLLLQLQSKQEDWSATLSALGASAEKAGVELKEAGGKSAVCRLSGLFGSEAALPQRYLVAGRRLYPEELTGSDRVILLDEQLAIALFRVGDPVGREVILDGQTYTVAGILTHSRAAGEQEAYGAYAPLLALDAQQLDMDVLTVWGTAIPGTGAASSFQKSMAELSAQGDFYNLQQERFRTLLPLKALLIVLGVLLLQCGFRFFTIGLRAAVEDIRDRLRIRFAVQLSPRIALYVLGVSAALAVLLAGCYYLAQYALQIVYTFPEWVPAVPVEPSDIAGTFWTNRTTVTKLVEYRSSQLLTYRFFRGALCGACAAAGGLLLPCYGALRRWMKETFPPFWSAAPADSSQAGDAVSGGSDRPGSDASQR